MAKEEKVCISEGNTKMGSVKSVSLPAYTTCRHDCECAKVCYAMKGRYLFSTIKDSLERNLKILKNNPDQYWEEVNEALLLNRYFRFHVSGDIPNYKYLEKMVEAANKNKATEILCFTKKYELVNKFIKKGNAIPANLHLIFSKWRGTDMPNPYQLPEAHIFYADGTTTASPEAKPCGGHCINCIKKNTGCWSLKNGEQVVIVQH